jgi:hypothetical protein
MAMALITRIVAVGAAAALVALAQAQTPPASPPTAAPDGDPQRPVIVTGQRPDIDLSAPKPTLHGGQWRFSRVPGGTRPIDFTTCLQNDDLESALRRVAAERSNQPHHDMCSAMKLNVQGGKITGRRSCLHGNGNGTSASDYEYTFSGRYDARKLTLNVAGGEMTDGFTEARHVPRPKTWGWHITATRLGDCPARPTVTVRTIDEAAALLFDPDADAALLDGL